MESHFTREAIHLGFNHLTNCSAIRSITAVERRQVCAESVRGGCSPTIFQRIGSLVRFPAVLAARFIKAVKRVAQHGDNCRMNGGSLNMKQPKKMMSAPKRQAMPSTPPSRAEKGTSRPSKKAKLQMPPAPQPVPQNVRRSKGVRA